MSCMSVGSHCRFAQNLELFALNLELTSEAPDGCRLSLSPHAEFVASEVFRLPDSTLLRKWESKGLDARAQLVTWL